MQQLAENISAKERQHPCRMLGTLSSGYDSATVTTLARQDGCNEVICFDRARDGENDSVEAIARLLGVQSINVQGDAWRSMRRPEIPFIASHNKATDCPKTHTLNNIMATVSE